MAIDVRTITPDEVDDLCRVLYTAFGEEATADKLEDERTWAESDRLIGAVDAGRFVGAAGAYTFDMTLPGLTTVPVAGVTWVGVLPTHRRTGILSRMMKFQLDDVVARGEPVAVLTASEAGIYGRFGYGIASRLASITLDTRGGVRFLAEPDVRGRMRMIDQPEREAMQPKLYDAVRRERVGELSRPDLWWTMYWRDREYWREDASQRYTVVHEDARGDVDGYVTYRIKEDWGDDGPNSAVHLVDMAALGPEVEAAFWRFLCDIDLTVKVKSWNQPVVDPIALRLADWRRYKVTKTADQLWARVLDVPAALSARRYEEAGELVLEVDDPFRKRISGMYRLTGDPESATCVRVRKGEPDLRLGIAALGSLLLGDVAPSTLAAAGRLRPSSPDALAIADRMFPTTIPPYSTQQF